MVVAKRGTVALDPSNLSTYWSASSFYVLAFYKFIVASSIFFCSSWIFLMMAYRFFLDF